MIDSRDIVPATCSSGCRRARSTADVRRGGVRRAHGACSSRAGHAAAAREPPPGPCSRPPTRSPRCRRSRAPGAASSARRLIGIPAPRKDVGEGHPARAARAAAARRRPRELQHEIGLPLELLAAPGRHGGAGAGDGHARPRPRSRSWPRSRSRTSASSRASARSTWSCSAAEAIAAAKAELLAGMRAARRPSIPAGEPLLERACGRSGGGRVRARRGRRSRRRRRRVTTRDRKRRGPRGPHGARAAVHFGAQPAQHACRGGSGAGDRGRPAGA